MNISLFEKKKNKKKKTIVLFSRSNTFSFTVIFNFKRHEGTKGIKSLISGKIINNHQKFFVRLCIIIPVKHTYEYLPYLNSITEMMIALDLYFSTYFQHCSPVMPTPCA